MPCVFSVLTSCMCVMAVTVKTYRGNHNCFSCPPHCTCLPPPCLLQGFDQIASAIRGADIYMWQAALIKSNLPIEEVMASLDRIQQGQPPQRVVREALMPTTTVQGVTETPFSAPVPRRTVLTPAAAAATTAETGGNVVNESAVGEGHAHGGGACIVLSCLT